MAEALGVGMELLRRGVVHVCKEVPAHTDVDPRSAAQHEPPAGSVESNPRGALTALGSLCGASYTTLPTAASVRTTRALESFVNNPPSTSRFCPPPLARSRAGLPLPAVGHCNVHTFFL